ncbi:YpoC family protein [Peribacillus acanthi]|uniref:YpoC family protein n=1 Tax=Peribacillus acanthi TaxID=2171554 RepID=UPI000D3E6AC0|nr:hypothetical protein [Peribacillus acanthi]
MEQLIVKITDEHELFHPFFWGEKSELHLNIFELEEMDVNYDPTSFLYELYHSMRVVEAFKPWESASSIELLLEQWQSYYKSLHASFQKRDFELLLPLMKKGIACCFSILFWTNKQPVSLKNWQAMAESFTYKPINFSERMNFILSRPKLFHSFIQLSELMDELTKIYHKSIILNKRKNV